MLSSRSRRVEAVFPVICLALLADTRWKAVGLDAVSNTARLHASGGTLTFLRRILFFTS